MNKELEYYKQSILKWSLVYRILITCGSLILEICYRCNPLCGIEV